MAYRRGMRKYLDSILIYGGGVLGFIAFFKNDFPALWTGLSNMSGRTALLTISILAVVIGLILKWREKRVTLRNVRTKLRDWLYAFELQVGPITPPDTHFGWQVNLTSGLVLWILRTTRRDKYLTFFATVPITEENKLAFQGMTLPEKSEF